MSVLKKLCVFLLLGVAVAAQRGAPQTYPPTAEQRQMIDAKLADLTSRIKALAAKKTDAALLADVDIYRKAADFILRYPEEFSTKNYAPETIKVLDDGLARAKDPESGGSSRTKKTGHVLRRYNASTDARAA